MSSLRTGLRSFVSPFGERGSYTGNWIAIRDKKIIAYGPELGGVFDSIKNDRVPLVDVEFEWVDK